MYQIGWFSTGRDKAARDLLGTVRSSIKQDEIEAEIAFIFCNREPGESEESDLFPNLVEEYHIPLVCFSYHKYKSARDMRNPRPGELLPQWRLDHNRRLRNNENIGRIRFRPEEDEEECLCQRRESSQG